MTASDGPTPLGRRMVRVLAVVLALEALITAGAVGLLVYEQFTATPLSRTSSLALLVTAAIALVLVVAITIGAVRRGPWVRGAAVTWQVLQLAAAWTVVQGDLAPVIGWVLTALSAVGIVAALHPATRTALRPRRA